MATRMEEQQQQRRREASESGTRHHLAKKASSASAATASASQDAQAQQPIIIECRKKNSKQESVVTHRFRKGKLLGKVRGVSREQRRTKNMRIVLFSATRAQKKWATAKKRRENRLLLKHGCEPTGTMFAARSCRDRVSAFLRAWPLRPQSPRLVYLGSRSHEPRSLSTPAWRFLLPFMNVLAPPLAQ